MSCAILVFAAVQYVQPEGNLDLTYTEISLSYKIVEMIKRRQLSVTLNEAEVNDLLKKVLSQHPQPAEHIQIVGATFDTYGDQMIADVHMKYRGKWDIGAKLYFLLSWNNPSITVTHVRTDVKSIHVPSGLLQLNPISINLNDYLPRLIGVKDVRFEKEQIVIYF